MTRTPLNRLLTERTLTRMTCPIPGATSDVHELMLEHAPEGTTKQLCAKISPQLMTRLDQTCDLLNIHKRQFVESALIEALSMADRIMDEEQLFVAIGVVEPQEDR